MTTDNLSTPAADAQAHEPVPPQDAELWQRVAARLVDQVVAALATAILLAPLAAVSAVLGGPVGFLAGALSAVLASVMTLAGFTLLESRPAGTPGKRLLGLRVVDDAGRTPTTDVALRRNLWTGLGIVSVVPVVGGFLATLAIVLAAGTILVGLAADSRPRRGWHDVLAGGTRVVRDR